MSKRRMDREDRLEQKYRKLGTRNPICVTCGEEDPLCLVFDQHHIGRKEHHKDVSIVCCNCHRKLTDQQLDHAPLVAEEPSCENAVIGYYLLGLSDLLAMAAPTLRHLGEQLLDESTSEDDV